MFSKGNRTITQEDLLSLFTEEQILCRYIPQLKRIPAKICSPFRKDDNPSVGISLWNNHIVWKDFATGEKGNIWSFLQRLLSIPFKEVYERVFSDMVGKKTISISVSTGNYSKKLSSSECEIGTVRREWTEDDFEYWGSYGITKGFLKKSHTYPISYILLKYDAFTSVIKADKYAYVYIEKKDDIITQKIYQPFNKKGWKWRSNSNASVWNLWTLLPEKGDTLIITSSKKDAMCLWCNVGIPAVCPQSEGTELKPQVIEQLKQRFKNIYVLYDNDFGRDENPGREMGRKLADEFGLKQIEIPEEYQAKDPSDLYKKHGKKVFISTILSLLDKDETA